MNDISLMRVWHRLNRFYAFSMRRYCLYFIPIRGISSTEFIKKNGTREDSNISVDRDQPLISFGNEDRRWHKNSLHNVFRVRRTDPTKNYLYFHPSSRHVKSSRAGKHDYHDYYYYYYFHIANRVDRFARVTIKPNWYLNRAREVVVVTSKPSTFHRGRNPQCVDFVSRHRYVVYKHLVNCVCWYPPFFPNQNIPE